MSGIRTPLNTTPAIALGNKKWVKEILRTGPLHYNGNVFDVTPDYLDTVAQAYQDGALKRVPFQLAGKANEHDESPERRRGFIEGVWREGDKLKSLIDLEDEANNLVETDLSFPVSVLIKHDRTKGNTGQHWDAVLTHVLGTYDPVLDLDDWEPYLAASNQDDDVIDFLALAAKPGEPEATDTPSTSAKDAPDAVAPAADPSEGTTDMPTLADILAEASADDLAKLRAALAEPEKPAEDDETDGSEEEGESTETEGDSDALSAEDEAMIAAILASADDAEETEAQTVEEPTAVAASHSDDNDALALANARLDEQNLALGQMQRKLDERDWEAERDALHRSNVPRSIVELAKPFLHGSHTSLALSQSERPKVAAQVRKILDEVGKSYKALGLSQGPLGTAEDASAEAEAKAADERRTSSVSAHLKNAGLITGAR